jgi:hypothetical protein
VTDTVLLVGAGAENGAWRPVIQAIRDTDPGAGVVQDPDHANFYMAKLIAVVRGFCAIRDKTGKQPPGSILDKLRQLKDRISIRLREAADDQTLTLHPHFLATAGDFEWTASKLFVTTNWDDLIERAFPSEKVHHLHGAISSPSSLFLPSDYGFDSAHSAEVRESMMCAQDDCIKELWKARTVVIYGLGLAPIDGELAAVCATGFARDSSQQPLERIVIYNVEKARRQILDRVKLLLAGTGGRRSVCVDFRACPA